MERVAAPFHDLVSLLRRDSKMLGLEMPEIRAVAVRSILAELQLETSKVSILPADPLLPASLSNFVVVSKRVRRIAMKVFALKGPDGFRAAVGQRNHKMVSE